MCIKGMESIKINYNFSSITCQHNVVFNSFMQIHSWFLFESLLTKTANVWSVLLMNHIMFVQRRIFSESLWTAFHLTHIRLFARMNTYVIFVIRWRWKSFPTIGIRATIWSFSSMGPYVHFPDVGCGKTFVTSLNRTLKWFFA